MRHNLDAQKESALSKHITRLAGSLLLLVAGDLRAAPAAPDQQVPPSAPHHANRAYLGQDIFVAPGQQIANATCIFCSVQVDGDVSGNVLVLFGNLTVTGNVSGNTTVLGGNAVVDSQARIGGNTTIIDGNAVYETDDSLSGNAWVLGGHISSSGGRQNLRRRIALSPSAVTAALVLLILLLAGILFPRTRHHASAR